MPRSYGAGDGSATNCPNFTNSEQAHGARPTVIDRVGSPPTCLPARCAGGRRQAQPDHDRATPDMRGTGALRRGPELANSAQKCYYPLAKAADARRALHPSNSHTLRL